MRRPFFQRGASMVEAIIAVAFIGIGGSAVAMLILGAYSSAESGGLRTQASALGRQTIEAVRGVEMHAYNRLAAGTYGLSEAGGFWGLAPSPDAVGPFTRSILIENVTRDGSGNIAAGTNDVHTRKVTTTISWTQRGLPKQQVFVDYLTNWARKRLFEDTVADFADGTFNDAQTATDVDADGAISLLENVAAFWACMEVDDSADIPGSSVDALSVTQTGSYALIGTQTNNAGTEFRIYDVSDPENITLTGSLELGADVYAISVVGNFAFLATSDNTAELRVVNITTPSAPTSAGTLNLAGNADGLDVVASGSRAYLVRQGSADPEFATIDIGTPGSPVLLGSVDLGDTSRGVQLAGTHAYVVTDGDAQEFRVVNVSVDVAPAVVQTINLPSNANGVDVDVYLSYAYVVTDNNASGSEFYTINITTPASAAVSGSVDLGNGATAIELDGTVAFVGTAASQTRTLQIVDAVAPSAPALSVSLNLSNDSYAGLYWNGTRLLVAARDNNAEFQVLKRQLTPGWHCIENKGNFNVAANQNGLAVHVVGNTLYAATDNNNAGNEFITIDVTNPFAPTQLGSLNLADSGNDIDVEGTVAYVASNDNAQELKIVSVAVPAAPAQLGSFNAAGNTDALGVDVSGTIALLAQGSTLRRLNVAVPALVTQTGSVALAGIGYRVAILNATHAFVATGGDSAEIQVINWSGATPTIAGSFNLTGNSDARSLWIKGTQLYVATDSNGGGPEFYILDISNPIAPTLVGSFEIGSNARGVATDDNESFSFVGSSQTGEFFRVLDVTNPASPTPSSIVTEIGGQINDAFFSGDLVFLASDDDANEFLVYGKLAGPGGGGGGAFTADGTYESGILDAGIAANWNTIEWSEILNSCPSGDIALQVRTATTSGGLATELWQGPEGEDADDTDFFTDPVGSFIHLSHNGDRFFQYRVSLSGDQTCTILLSDISVTYSPWQ